MAKEGSVAPKERINIKYIPATGDQQAELELPLKMLVMGDFKGREEDTPLEERQAVEINNNTFNDVMAKAELSANISVKNHLVDDENSELPVELNFASLSDFTPDEIVKKVPQLNQLIELRKQLTALKGPLGNIPEFRKHLQAIIDDEASRNKLLSELEITDDSEQN